MMAEEHLPDMVIKSWSQSHRGAYEGFAYTKSATTERDTPLVLDFTHHIIRSILNGWQHLRERAWAKPISASRCSKLKSFMRPLKVVNIPPAIKGFLASLKVYKAVVSEHFSLKGTVEPFIFTLSLRVVCPSMTDSNVQPEQPNRERYIGMVSIISPGATIISQDTFRQAIAPEYSCEALFDRFTSLIATGLQSQGEAGVVIQNSKGMAAPTRDGEMSFEVHLPELIRRLMLKALPRAMFGSLLWVCHAMTLKDGSYGARAGKPLMTSSQEIGSYLTSTPGRMLGAHIKYSLFYVRRSLRWAVYWPTRVVCKTLFSLSLKAPQPLISRPGSYTVATAQFSYVGVVANG